MSEVDDNAPLPRVWRIVIERRGVSESWCAVVAVTENDALAAGMGLLQSQNHVVAGDGAFVSATPLFALAALRLPLRASNRGGGWEWVCEQWPEGIQPSEPASSAQGAK